MSLRSPLINVMAGAAFRAAKGLIRDFGEVEQLQVSRKGPADFVSAADTRTEKQLYEDLHRARPDFGFLMEERGEIKGDAPERWVVDPLDGTTNFLHGLPHFAISIAVQSGKKIEAGVIYDPIKDEMFWAERGRGAFMNDRRLRVSARADMKTAILATGVPWHGKEGHGLFRAELSRLTDKIAGIRRFGSASLDLAYVAAGRYEAFWERGLNAWDIAAGIILIEEAGGMVSEPDGGSRMLSSGDILASNEKLYDAVRTELRHARKQELQTGGQGARVR